MSRIGKVPIKIPEKVEVKLTPTQVTVKGPKGTLGMEHHGRVKVTNEDGALVVQRFDDSRQARAYHGLYQRLLSNCVTGVTEGFRRELEIQGVGYRVALQGRDLSMNMGYSNPVIYKAPDGITFQVPKPTSIVVEGVDKQVVGQTASEIRSVRPVEPYKGKGIRYVGERVIRKAGKSTK